MVTICTKSRLKVVFVRLFLVQIRFRRRVFCAAVGLFVIRNVPPLCAAPCRPPNILLFFTAAAAASRLLRRFVVRRLIGRLAVVLCRGRLYCVHVIRVALYNNFLAALALVGGPPARGVPFRPRRRRCWCGGGAPGCLPRRPLVIVLVYRPLERRVVIKPARVVDRLPPACASERRQKGGKTHDRREPSMTSGSE